MESLRSLFKRKSAIEREVDEEFEFHLEMQSLDLEERGAAPAESRAMAEKRFGDVEEIRKECIQISSRRRIIVLALNSIFIMSFFVGFLLRMMVAPMQVNRVGDVLMMIGGLGMLLVYFKQSGAFVLRKGTEPFRLGLSKKSAPIGFDEKGRSPFDRVRTEE